MMTHKLVTCLLVVICAAVCHSLTNLKDKMKLKDIEVITLHSGSMTTGRRSNPVPQLNHKGSSSFNRYLPSTVQCYNRGHDGYDVQWECVAELPVEVKFGQINVLCEGFDYPDDPYILRGSCGLEYRLELTGAGQRQNSYSSYRKPNYSQYQESPSRGGSLIPLIIICVLIYLVYAVCIAPLQVRQTPRPEADIREGQQQERELTNRNTNVQQGPGFWTGAGIGGILGGLFGLGAYIGQDYYLQQRRGGGGYGGGGGGSSGSRRSAGFGGTIRR